jgi:hypothetical protein
MAQPDKYASCVLGDEKFMFVLNHEGRWAAEDLLDKEWPEIAFAYDRGLLGTRIQTAVVFAITRRHHGRELPDRRAVMRLLERVEEADEDEQIDFTAAMHAAMTGRPKKEVLEDFRRAEREAEGEEPDEDEEEAEQDGDPKDPEPEGDSKPSKTAKKRSGSRSGAGTSS